MTDHYATHEQWLSLIASLKERKMTKTPWTPGPWEADGAEVIATKPFRKILLHYDRTVAANIDKPEAEANACLIAEAPAMAELLVRVLAVDHAEVLHDDIRALLARLS